MRVRLVLSLLLVEAEQTLTFPDVFDRTEAQTFAVWESGRAKSGDKDAFLGYMTLDLFPRENSAFILPFFLLLFPSSSGSPPSLRLFPL